MYLYLAHKNSRHELTNSRHELTYICGTVSNIKVVACPFCGVSTSSGERLSIFTAHLIFRCFTCQVIALSSQTTKPVTIEEIENLHPHKFVADDANFYLVEIYKIISMTDVILIGFTWPDVITNDDVIAFYSDLKKFGDENKVNVRFIGRDIADKFLKDNELAQKYKIEYSEKAEKSYLSLRIDSYSLTDIPFDNIISVTFIDEYGYETVVYFKL